MTDPTPRRPTAGRTAFAATTVAAAATALLLASGCASMSPGAEPVGTAPAPRPLPALEVNGYLGTWHQLALYPNRFQAQCVSQTTATYALRDDGRLSVLNRCRTADGAIDEAQGVARPRDGARIEGGRLQPASLEVSFLPAWLRWAPVGWGRYDVLQRLRGDTVSIVGEPSREYLWVLSRQPTVTRDTWREIESWLKGAGYDVARLRVDPAAVAP